MKGTITCTKEELRKAQNNGLFYIKSQNPKSGAEQRLFLEPIQLYDGWGRLWDTKNGKYYIEGEMRILSKSSQVTANIEEARIAKENHGHLIMVRENLAQYVGD